MCADFVPPPLASGGMPTSVVTGGAGFLGSHLCDALLERGDRVICVDNLETGSLQNVEHHREESFLFLNHDLIEPVRLDQQLGKARCNH